MPGLGSRGIVGLVGMVVYNCSSLEADRSTVLAFASVDTAGRTNRCLYVNAEGVLAAFESAGDQPEQKGAQKAAADGELAGLVACLRRTGRLPDALAAARDAAGAEIKQAIRYINSIAQDRFKNPAC